MAQQQQQQGGAGLPLLDGCSRSAAVPQAGGVPALPQPLLEVAHAE